VQASKLVMFANSSQSKLPPNGTALTPLASTELHTSLVKEGRFATDRFTATNAGLEILTSGVYNDTAGNDLNAMTFTEMWSFIGRTFFAWYFSSGNEPAEKGNYLDFPWARGMATQGNSTAAETWVTRSVINGAPGEEGKLLKTPVSCTPDTTPRLDLTFPRGAVACTVDFAVRAHITGFTG
jgi:hypothetical protein